MEQTELRGLEDKCTQESPPACTAACPIHVDVRTFMAKVKHGDFQAALEVLHKKQPFPGIISRICDHPCQDACKRKEAGSTLAIGELERYCEQNYTARPVKPKLLPKRSQRVAIVGGGLSGLTAAHDLAKKGYTVVLFEAGSELGGRLLNYSEQQLPRAILQQELAVLLKLGIETRLNTALGEQLYPADLVGEFSAVYLGVGANCKESFGLEVNPQGQVSVDQVTLATSMNGVFAGGSMCSASASPISSVADGRRAAISVDRYLQNSSLTAARDNEGAFVTNLFVNTKEVVPTATVGMANPQLGYTAEEAMAEAGRCIDCQCLECVKVCKFMENFGAYPKKYLREIYNNESIVMGKRHANKMINSCSLCGLCAQVCPQGLDLGETCKAARRSMVQRDKMPPSAHDFALRDMAFSNSQKFALTRHEPGKQGSSYLFFPGCQLSASAPEQVEQVYAYLRAKLSGGVGLMLRCCGAPADWAGHTALFQANLREIRQEWEEMNRPRLVVACSSCYQAFKAEIPDVVSLWELMDELGLPTVAKPRHPGRLAVHDACSTRQEPKIHTSVRNILTKLGYATTELPYNKELTKCCGYGGLMSAANPAVAKVTAAARVAESADDYVAYCAMCRDNFAKQDKRTFHLLDLIFGNDLERAATRIGPGFSERHEKRARLKNQLLQQVWGEKPAAQGGYEAIKLIISDFVKQTMETRLILDEDIQKVIEYAESTGRKFFNPDNGRSLAYYKPVSVTYWVEYVPQADGFIIYNAYSHRMEIVEDVKHE